MKVTVKLKGGKMLTDLCNCSGAHKQKYTTGWLSFHSQYSLECWKLDTSKIFLIWTYINILSLIFETLKFVHKALIPYFFVVESNKLMLLPVVVKLTEYQSYTYVSSQKIRNHRCRELMAQMFRYMLSMQQISYIYFHLWKKGLINVSLSYAALMAQRSCMWLVS